MKKAILFFLFIIWATPFWAQQCEANYQFVCDSDRRNDDEIKRVEAQLTELRCKKEKFAKQKEELLACATAEKARVNTEKIKSVLIDALREVEKLQAQPQLPKPCVGGNCN